MQMSKRVIIPVIGVLFVIGIALSTVIIQTLIDNEVQKQLKSTETDIIAVSITGITVSPLAANLTLNVSASNPYDLIVTLDATQFKILYEGTQFGVIYLPEIIIEEYVASILINTTLEISGVSALMYAILIYNFTSDFLDDDNVTIRVTGPLTMHAPALFLIVTSTIIYDTNITLTSEGIL